MWKVDDKVCDQFLSELSELSRKYGLGISEAGIVYELEADDHSLLYTLGDEGDLRRRY
jgi:hypothetical protein